MLLTQFLEQSYRFPQKKVLEILKSENLKLIDEIKILLGSDVCWELQTGEKKRVHKNLYAVSSIFGWIIWRKPAQCIHVYSCLKEENVLIEDCVKRFWTLGENENQDDKSIIEQFENDLQFYSGRYVTRLWWESNHENLGNNLETAKLRLISLAEKFKNDE